MFGKKKSSGKSMTKEELAGEIYDLNKANGKKNPFSRNKAINIMVNGSGTAKGYTKAELAELRDDLLKKQAQSAKVPKEPKKADKPAGATLSPKVARADELRRAALKAGDKAMRITKKSNEEFQNAKTPEEKAAVRKKYAEKRKQAKFDSGKAFREYDDYLQKEFGIDNAYMETNEAYTSTERGFINWLQAKFSKRNKGAKK